MSQVILSRKKAHRDHLIRNLATSVILYEFIDTTIAKAKAARGLVEKWITYGKKGTLDSRRALLAQTFDPLAADKVFDILKQRYATRNGGYTRIVRLGKRIGDGGTVARLELVDRDMTPSSTQIKTKKIAPTSEDTVDTNPKTSRTPRKIKKLDKEG